MRIPVAQPFNFTITFWFCYGNLAPYNKGIAIPFR